MIDLISAGLLAQTVIPEHGLIALGTGLGAGIGAGLSVIGGGRGIGGPGRLGLHRENGGGRRCAKQSKLVTGQGVSS